VASSPSISPVPLPCCGECMVKAHNRKVLGGTRCISSSICLIKLGPEYGAPKRDSSYATISSSTPIVSHQDHTSPVIPQSSSRARLLDDFSTSRAASTTKRSNFRSVTLVCGVLIRVDSPSLLAYLTSFNQDTYQYLIFFSM
jgi:hypothetical protein